VLDARMTERGIDKEHYAWYRDLRPLRHRPARRLRARLRAYARLRDGALECARRDPVSADAGERKVLEALSRTHRRRASNRDVLQARPG